MCNSKRITPGVTWTYPLSNVSREREREREREWIIEEEGRKSRGS